VPGGVLALHGGVHGQRGRVATARVQERLAEQQPRLVRGVRRRAAAEEGGGEPLDLRDVTVGGRVA
jgi:hypothetical protein